MTKNSSGKSVTSSNVSRNFKKSHKSYEMNKPLVIGLGSALILLAAFLIYRFIPIPPIVEPVGGVDSTDVDPQVTSIQYESHKRKKYNRTGASFSVFSISYTGDLAERIEFRPAKGRSIGKFIRSIRSEGPSVPDIFPSEDDFFAITGAMFDIDNLPPGLTVSRGEVLKELNTSSGQGNFYDPQPNGVFYVNDKDAEIVTTDDYLSGNKPIFALQSGPMLVIDGDINPSIGPSNPSRYTRCAVGLNESQNGQKTIVFVSSRDKVNLYELADFMKGQLECKQALHLESINAFIHFPGSDYPIGNQTIQNFIVIK